MPGGLLQLVAIGIDSIFLTSNPSITLFKTVYKRHTNFTIVSRTNQIPNVKDFDMEGTYILKKDGDCIHKMWLKIDISDFKLEYPKSTYKNIKELCNKYSIEYVADKEDNDIVSYTEYVNDVIPLFLNKIESSVSDFNKHILYIDTDNNYNTTVMSNKKEKYTNILKYCLNGLYTSYKNDTSETVYVIFHKIELIKKMLSDEYLLDSDGNEIVINQTDYNYELLDAGEYLYNNYIFDNIEYIYKYAINRNDADIGMTDIINEWVDLYFDKLFYDVLQLKNSSEIFLVESEDNSIQELKYRTSQFIDLLNVVVNNLYKIYNGKNTNALTTTNFDRTETQLARFDNLSALIKEITDKLGSFKYLNNQYKHIIDYNVVDIKNTYDEIYNILFDTETNIKSNDITEDLLNNTNNIIDNLLTRMYYSLGKLNESITDNADHSGYSDHVIQKFEYFMSTDTYNNYVSVPNMTLFNVLNSYLKDLLNTPEFDEKIYSVNQINDILYNEYLNELTYNILGFRMYDDDFNLIGYDDLYNGVNLVSNGILYTKEEFFLKIKMMYLSFILIYIIEAGIPFNKNMVDIHSNYLGTVYDTSKYYGVKMIDYFDKIIESNKNPLVPILNFDEPNEVSSEYKSIDTYKILKKFLKNTDIIHDENSFNDTFNYKLTQTIKQNIFANIHILYSSILDTILTASRHNITQLTRISSSTEKDYVYDNTNELLTEETDYYKFSFFKTFTNQISDTNKFTKIFGSSDVFLNDNFSSVFSNYQQNKSVYTVYFAEDIVKSVPAFCYNISKYFEKSFFSGFFNDYKLWERVVLSNGGMVDILKNLTFDKETGNIIDVNYYYDTEFHKRSTDPSDNSYINSNHNIYTKFISPLSDKTKNNLGILNYIPFLTIRDFATEFYEFIKYEAENTQENFNTMLNNLYIFDFRDLDQYDVLTKYDSDEQSVINENLTFKHKLYREIVLKCLLRINRDKDKTNGKYDKDFEVQIFDGNILRLADSQYIEEFSKTYISTDNIALFSLFRPENMIDITDGFESEIEVSEPVYNDGNVDFQFTEKKIYMPLIRGIIERYRLKFLDVINKNYNSDGYLIDSDGNIIDPINNYIEKSGVAKLKEFVNKILNNYVKFDDSINIDNANYSFSTYKSNGYSFNYIDFQSVSGTDIGVNGLANLKIIKTKQNTYVQAASSLYSYINKQMIREYNTMYNDLILSDTYYGDNLGENMKNLYYFIKSNLVDASDNNVQFYQQDQIQYYYTYKYKNGDMFDPNSETDKIYLYDIGTGTIPTTNYTFPISSHGLNYYSFGDTISMDKNGDDYVVAVQQDVFYYKIYDAYFNNMSILDYEYFITMSFLGYDVRRSLPYDEIANKVDYVYKVPQYTPYYTNLLRIRTKIKDTKLNIMTSLEEIIDSLNDYNSTTGEYLYYSGAESKIADRVKEKMLTKYKVLKDIIQTTGSTNIETKSIYEFVHTYENTTNDFTKNYTINGLTKLILDDNVVTGEEIIGSDTYNVFENSYSMKDTLSSTQIENMLTAFDIYSDYINTNLYNIFSPTYFNNYLYKSDVVKLFIFTLINNTNLNFYIYDKYDGSIDTYNNAIQQILITNKLTAYNYIKSVTRVSRSSITLSDDTYINFRRILPYIEELYTLPDYYEDTDILYHGTDVDLLFRNITGKTPVKHCWVPELAQYLIENISLEFDDLLIDEQNSYLRSLLNKLRNNFEHKKTYDTLIGNTDKLKSYDSTNKGTIILRLPLDFFFCKEINLSLPMINLLYTKAKINFKLRKLEDLLIYDKNAIFIKKPTLKLSMETQYIYLEEDERKKISISRHEILIEKFKHYGKFNYNYSHLIDNKLSTLLRPTDPTKYLLWRIKIVDSNKIKYNYNWNKNGYNIYEQHNSIGDFIVTGYENIKTTEDIKIYFNGSTREQGKAELFNTVFPYSRLLGSLDNDDYIYVFSLYPLMICQPSGCANLTNIEEVKIEYTFTDDFIEKIKDNKLNIECEYWTCTYDILRFVSGMCAPLFYS